MKSPVYQRSFEQSYEDFVAELWLISRRYCIDSVQILLGWRVPCLLEILPKKDLKLGKLQRILFPEREKLMFPFFNYGERSEALFFCQSRIEFGNWPMQVRLHESIL